MVKHKVFGAAYRNIFKPLAFQLDAEWIHNAMTVLGENLEVLDPMVSAVFAYNDPRLAKRVLGIEFPNPIGLAAGFDYDGHLAQTMKSVGFGFNTVGTVTAKSYEGNKLPRLARLPKSKSLLVNKGFKSEGAVAIAKRLDRKNLSGHVVGLSVGSSNRPEVNSISKAIDDYLFTFDLFRRRKYIKYFELNISCPNTAMPEPFTDDKNFGLLVKEIGKMGLAQPVFVKMPNEILPIESDRLVRLGLKHGIKGYIFSNLVKDRKNAAFDKEEIKKIEKVKGNFSGRPTFINSNALISRARKIFGENIAIIGCGGVFGSEDAIEKFRAGADLLQLITGMIFEGPQLAGEINYELARRKVD